MTPEKIEQERKAFEAWMVELYPTNPQTERIGDEYSRLGTQYKWEGWQARAAQSEWISVEDSLPETEGYVIVAWANGYVELSRFTRDKYSHGGSWHPDFIPDDITHWQPLPEPPETRDK